MTNGEAGQEAGALERGERHAGRGRTAGTTAAPCGIDPLWSGAWPLISSHLGKLVCVKHAGIGDAVVQRNLQPPLALLQGRRRRVAGVAGVRPKLLPRLVPYVPGLLLVRRGRGMPGIEARSSTHWQPEG